MDDAKRKAARVQRRNRRRAALVQARQQLLDEGVRFGTTDDVDGAARRGAQVRVAVKSEVASLGRAIRRIDELDSDVSSGDEADAGASHGKLPPLMERPGQGGGAGAGASAPARVRGQWGADELDVGVAVTLSGMQASEASKLAAVAPTLPTEVSEVGVTVPQLQPVQAVFDSIDR